MNVPKLIQDEILQRLQRIESEHQVHILYACESGSRAWGFASSDSDYDVRFIYVRPLDWYLSYDIEQQRDVIEQPIVDEIDCSGWDLRKALYLLTRSNGALIEWLHSPTVYLERDQKSLQTLRALTPKVMQPIALGHHYRQMAQRQAEEHLTQSHVSMKKYFYVLRPLFALRYLEMGLGVPPVKFSSLMQAVAPPHLVSIIEALLERKQQYPETAVTEAIPEIHAYVEQALKRPPQITPTPASRQRVALNALFRETVKRWTTMPHQA